MEINKNVEHQRTIKFYVDYIIKRSKQKNSSGTISKLYSPRYFTIEPREYILLDSGVDFELPEEVRATVVSLPPVLRAELSTLQVSLNNETFTRTFKFNKNDSIGAFVILSEKDSETFDIEYGSKTKQSIKILDS